MNIDGKRYILLWRSWKYPPPPPRPHTRGRDSPWSQKAPGKTCVTNTCGATCEQHSQNNVSKKSLVGKNNGLLLCITIKRRVSLIKAHYFYPRSYFVYRLRCPLTVSCTDRRTFPVFTWVPRWTTVNGPSLNLSSQISKWASGCSNLFLYVLKSIWRFRNRWISCAWCMPNLRELLRVNGINKVDRNPCDVTWETWAVILLAL